MKEVVVPRMGESIAEASVAKIVKNIGDPVQADELLFELETDKASMEIPSPATGILREIKVMVGDNVSPDDILATIDDNVTLPKTSASYATNINSSAPIEQSVGKNESVEPIIQSAPVEFVLCSKQDAPAAKVLMANNALSASDIIATGKGGRITKEDVLNRLAKGVHTQAQPPTLKKDQDGGHTVEFPERIVPMSKLRQKIAYRLKESQNTAAMLTTFNEVDMGNVMQIRKQYKDTFEKIHGVKLGFMSFFVKAVILGLEEFPEINAEIRDTDIVYKDYYNIGVAVGSKNGLVVPVIRNAQDLSFAGIEKAILEYGKKARDGKIQPDDMQRGSFTISNGGIYGSLMSTPIINPPQSGILGMHAIKERAVVINGQILVRPMMYLALSYDHRIVDGKEAVSFLVRVKEYVENPERLLLKV
ncbi:dihydrolipoyllysine-residue succinyltransferase, E2 component [Neorickettsia helminthoeca str. Oregon]|uniref:Dihydrolipoyllysine-residue succinyltransferase component of 2-oxoglutarate dehydrogenase complex n=1 Tax=Neorickettsia helminthoeca str. Oregon TaxID=1286528 RepID=X5HK86_9RICK|nr:2-oxoglutarate dehydrogenase complex dihydrolipoyllysine-residue succinyltransferase [Neorickettsia helminthoeca]AHX11469.1 dihydrolipoyllysine-residue succinyltransferase, E2 component [Neorickettsia helminthoeca str. Oregon]